MLEIKCPFNRGNPLAATPPREPAWYYMPQVGAPVFKQVKSLVNFECSAPCLRNPASCHCAARARLVLHAAGGRACAPSCTPDPNLSPLPPREPACYAMPQVGGPLHLTVLYTLGACVNRVY